nr:MAG TPA: ESX-1 secretion-associated regulator [Myoviridae sp. ct3mI7]
MKKLVALAKYFGVSVEYFEEDEYGGGDNNV